MGDAARFACELKIDGVACALTYERGRLVRRRDAGRRRHGEDITANVRTVRGVPRALAVDGPARGDRGPRRDVLPGDGVRAAERASSLRSGQRPFVNPRNAAAGSLRQKDPKVTASRPLRLWVHSFGTRGRRRVRFASGVPGLGGARRACRCRRRPRRVDSIAERRGVPARTGRSTGTRSTGRSTAPWSRSTDASCSGSSAPRPRAAVGDRLQVPARGAHRPLLKTIDVHTGRTGKVTPFAVLEPVVRRRRHGHLRDAAQRGRGAAQGRAQGRHGDRAASGRRDPRDRGAGARPSGRRALGDGRCRRPAPRAGRRWSAPRARPTTAARTSAGARSQGIEWLFHFAGRGAMDIEHLGLHDGDAAARGRADRGPRGHLRARLPTSWAG